MILLLQATLVSATTFYLDASIGDDKSAGTSEATPWKSLETVNATAFHPGDRILFRSGQKWQGNLILQSSGGEKKPITVGRYGAGSLPRIDAEGKFEDAVRVYNAEYVEVRDLEVTNLGPEPGAHRRGVHVFLENFGTAHHVVLAGLYVHDVNGSNGNGDNAKDNGGIIFRTLGDRKPTRFDGLSIERNIVWKVDRSGIAAQSSHWPRSRWFPSLHVVIRDNFVEDTGGDGIVPWVTDRVIVEHNIALHANQRAHSYNAGIWPWSTDNSIFQLNEAAYTHGTLDGEGFDSDYNSRRTLFQYNYGHDNDGGFMLICTPGKHDTDNLGNIGTEVRYNISRDDHTRIFNLSAATDTQVHDNAFYVGHDMDVQLLIATDWQGWADGAVFRNNYFYVDGTGRFGHAAAASKDGTYVIAPGWAPAKGIVFEGNHYYGNIVDRPSDATGTRSPASEIPSIFDTAEPSFDPAHPELFNNYITAHRKWMMQLFEKQFGTPPRLEK